MQIPRAAFAVVMAFTPAFSPAQGFSAETVVSGLDQVCGMAVAPDGRIFVIERITGHIRVVEDGSLSSPWATVPAAGTLNSDDGFLGIAIDPGFLQNGLVYVFYTRDNGGSNLNVIGRLQEVSGVGTNLTEIGPAISSSHTHNGGPMDVGLDGKLYLLVGDRGRAANAQDLTNLNGKVLRLNIPDGSVPMDNPFPGSYIYSYGHRNMFGIAIHPSTGVVYASENGAQMMDEVNRVIPGGNYGWPIHEGLELTPDPNTEDPLLAFSPTIEPTGCGFYTGPLYPARYSDGWFLCKFSVGQVSFLELDAAGTAVLRDETILDLPGWTYDIVDGPDGNLWFLRSSGAGNRRGANELMRIVHAASPTPSLALTATANASVGASITLGVIASNGDLVIPWLGQTRFAAPVATPFGDQWVSAEIVLGIWNVVADSRAYLGLAVPNDPSLTGLTIHSQALVYSSGSFSSTSPDSLTLR